MSDLRGFIPVHRFVWIDLFNMAYDVKFKVIYFFSQIGFCSIFFSLQISFPLIPKFLFGDVGGL